MICNHLVPIEKALIARGIKEVSRGKAWSKNCREWVYYDCYFSDIEATIDRFSLDHNNVKMHSYSGTHDGSEHGLVCMKCNDAIMGIHPNYLNESTERFK